MRTIDVVRAWKDDEYRSGLTEAEQRELPVNPAGMVQLSDAQVSSVAGATAYITCGGTPFCLVTITYVMSCRSECDGSGWPTSCNALSYGCCEGS